MVEFTGRNLQQPNAIPFANAAQSAPVPNIASVFGAIDDELERKRRQQKIDADEAKEQEESGIFSDVLNEQTALVRGFAQGGEELTPAELQDVGALSTANDFERQEALKNPNVRAAFSKLERIEQARKQARTPDELERFFLQAADINKRIANDHPQFAEIVLKASKAALGFDPLEKAVGLEEAASIKQQELEEAQTKSLVEKARPFIIFNADGSFDVQDAVRKGQALAQQEFLLEQSKKQADLLVAQRVPEAELKRAMFSNFMTSANAVFETTIGTFGTSMLQQFPNIANDPASQTKFQEAWGVKRATFLAQQEQLISQIEDPSVQSDVRTALEARLKVFDNIYTGDFSTLANRTRTLDVMTKDLKININKAAPTLAILDQISSPVAASVINEMQQRGLLGNIPEELKAAIALGQEDGPEQQLGNFTNFVTGAVPLESMTEKQQKSVVKSAKASLDALAESPNDLKDNDLSTYSTMALQLAGVAATKNLPADQLASASNTLLSPSKMRLFERFATDPNADPARVQALAEGLEAVALKNMNAQIGTLRVPADLLTAIGDLPVPVFNSQSGRFEVSSTGGGISRTSLKILASINNSLEAVVALRPRTDKRTQNFSDLELKQFIVDSAGFQTTGQRIEVPEIVRTSAAAQPRQSRTQTEIVDEIVRLGAEGDRVGVENLLNQQQSSQSSEDTGPLPENILNPKIDAAASETGVDARLLRALVQQESGGNPSVRSSKGAIGLTQLLPGTARDLGVDPNDPDENLLGGATFLKQQLDRFGNTRKALAAFNAGPARVARTIEKFGDEWEEHLPEETQDYIQQVLRRRGAF